MLLQNKIKNKMRRSKGHQVAVGGSLNSLQDSIEVPNSVTNIPQSLAEKDQKIQILLRQLHENVIETQHEREKGSQSLESITKTFI